MNSEVVAVADNIGANAGQWMGDATDCNVYSLAAMRRAALTIPYFGVMQKNIIYDRALTQLELQQIYSRGFGPNGPRWYPDH